MTSFLPYFRTSTQHYIDLETSLKKNTQATDPYLTRIRGLWRKLNIADPPDTTIVPPPTPTLSTAHLI